MPIIACLGWGSLIWDPGALPIQRQWFSDGPFVQAEFLRRSNDGRITLVLDESAEPVRALWAVMDSKSTKAARTALRKREGISSNKEKDYVGVWNGGENPPMILHLPEWARTRSVDAVVWTALPQKFHASEAVATSAEVVDYLRTLRGRVREEAERYIRNAPAQIDTRYRRDIEAALGWCSLS